ncbi:glutamate-rich 2-like isoform X2 [Labeo rohita]|uniref:Glutamate-rich 2-like isoform X2 n=1 Tax=Labeo rohita TaxID=84645 RepID=A0A498P223_LABRO|nr:glutamate-rich 2-like isoform X2 [Labeo rohita]
MNRQHKPKPSGKIEGQGPSVNSETTNMRLKAPSSTSRRGYNASKAPSFRNVTTHGHKLPKQVPPIMTALKKQGECDVQSENVHELHNQAPQVVLSANDQDPHEAQSEEDGNESAEGHVPLELFAEFLQAVMTKNYQLAKKLCQMSFLQKNNSLDEKNRMVGAFKESAKNQMSCDNSERFTRAETDFSNQFARGKD